MIDWSKYPTTLRKEIAKAERAGGRLLLVDEDKGCCCCTYTAFIDMAGVVALIAVDMVEGLAPTLDKVYLSADVLKKALRKMEGQEV